MHSYAPRSLAGKIIRVLLVLALLMAASGRLAPRRAFAAPAITTVSPAGGIVTGGTAVTIDGASFVSGATVTFGGVPATNVAFVSATQLTADSPANPAGPVTVVVTNPDTTAATLTNGFTYQVPAHRCQHRPRDRPLHRRHRDHDHRHQLHRRYRRELR